MLPKLYEMMLEESHWEWKDSVRNKDNERVYGFIYKIVNQVTGQDYIGQKSFVTAKRDWHFYQSSSKPLLADIKESEDYLEDFSFEILMVCKDKSSLLLAESLLIMQHIHGNNYNMTIPGQRFIKPTEHTEEVINEIFGIK